MLQGGCFCGAIRYEVLDAPFDSTICHCVDCRRVCAAPFIAWFTVKRLEFVVIRGQCRTLASSAKVLRGFCPVCGTHLTYQHADCPEEIDITTGSLDVPGSVPPKHHTWVAQKLPWILMGDGLPSYERGRSTH